MSTARKPAWRISSHCWWSWTFSPAQDSGSGRNEPDVLPFSDPPAFDSWTSLHACWFQAVHPSPVRVVISPRDTKWERERRRERSYQPNVWEKGRGLQAARLFLCLGHIFSGAEVGLSGRTGDGKWRGTEMHPKLPRPRQQDEETSILSTHENIHSEVCQFQPVDPSVCILVVQLMHPWSSNLENRCILSDSEQK